MSETPVVHSDTLVILDHLSDSFMIPKDFKSSNLQLSIHHSNLHQMTVDSFLINISLVVLLVIRWT